MEVDLVVALESHPTKLEVTFDIGNISSIVDIFSTKRGSKIVQNLVLARVSTPLNDSIAPMIFGATIKDDSKILTVGTNMDVGDLISIRPKTTTSPIIIAPSTSTTLKNIGLDVKIEVIDVTKVVVMEE
jgi:hypothetical protein